MKRSQHVPLLVRDTEYETEERLPSYLDGGVNGKLNKWVLVGLKNFLVHGPILNSRDGNKNEISTFGKRYVL